MSACTQCGRPYEPGQSFCAGCGRPILQTPSESSAVCPACGAALLFGARFCAQCGHAFGSADAEKEDAAQPAPALTYSAALRGDAPSELARPGVRTTEAESQPQARAAKRSPIAQTVALGLLAGLLVGGGYLGYAYWRLEQQRKTEAALARMQADGELSPECSAPSSETGKRGSGSGVRSLRGQERPMARNPWKVVSGDSEARDERPASVPEPSPSVPSPVKTPIYVLKRVPARIPLAAKMALVSGNVRVRVSVGANGEVLEATAVSGPRLLKKTACDNVRLWSFQPATLNGRSVTEQTEVEVLFSFDND